MSNEIAKKAAGEAAAQLVQSGMRIGLGTGSTSAYFITALAKRCRDEGLKIEAVASSISSCELAHQQNIPLIEVDQVTALDLDVDGADEIDPKKRMIKGGGGALLRERILAKMSREMIVICDESKLVKNLGKFPLPVEIIPFGYKTTITHIEKLGYRCTLRKFPMGNLFVTDNQNYVVDINLDSDWKDPESANQRIRDIPGVVDTGFFFNLAGRIIIGFNDGHTEIRS